MPKKSLISHWTDADEALLKGLAARGVTLLAATAALKRRRSSIEKKARAMGLHFAGPREIHAQMREAEASQLRSRK